MKLSRLPSKWLAWTLLLPLAAAGCGGGGSTVTPPPLTLTITTQSPLPRAVLSQAYSAKLQASGGVPPYLWSTTLLGIPGMTLATDGTLSGTPAQQASYLPTFTVKDSKGATANASIELDVIAPLSFATGPSLGDINIALPAYMYIAANGGVQPYTFTVTAGGMPPGVAFSSQNGVAVIQGTPTMPGNYTFTVQVTDSFSPPFKISQAFTLNVLNGLVVPNTTLPDAVQNIPYTEFIQPAGGTPPYHYVIGPNSALPPGLHLDTTTGKVFGTPTTTTAPFYDPLFMTITDSASPPASINPFVTITVQPQLSFQTTTLPDTARGLNYGATVYMNGGRAPYKVQVINGTLPNGLTTIVSGNGFNVTGVPTTDGLSKFTAQVSDSYETPNTAKQDFQIRVSDQMAISGPTQVRILYNQSYSTTFQATGGFPPYLWTISQIPPGLTFDATTGTLSGTPNGQSYTSPNVFVHDGSNPPLTASYFSFSLDVIGQLIISTTSLPTVATGSNLFLQPLTNGGNAPYQWTVSSGALPSGVKIGSVGGGEAIITGTPTAAGVYNFTLNLADGNAGNLHQTTSQQMTWIVKDRGQMTRNDTIAQAVPLSNINLLASISPFNDSSSAGPDVDVYSLRAIPGSVVQVYATGNNNFIQPPEPNSLMPIIEIVDSSGKRYATCTPQAAGPGSTFNLPCINGLTGNASIQDPYFSFQVPESGTAPLTFYLRVFDARGDARPDSIYTLSVFGVN